MSDTPKIKTGKEIDDWDTNPRYSDFRANQGAGGYTAGGGNISSIIEKGGKAYELVTNEGELVGVYAQGGAYFSNPMLASVMEKLGFVHGSVVLQTADGSFINSLSGFAGGNIYFATSISHQMVNQTFLQAGYANTINSISGSGWFTYASTMIYGNYGSAGPFLGYETSRER